jgi:hypothetical protein
LIAADRIAVKIDVFTINIESSQSGGWFSSAVVVDGKGIRGSGSSGLHRRPISAFQEALAAAIDAWNENVAREVTDQ